jgi:hypothetical protein
MILYHFLTWFGSTSGQFLSFAHRLFWLFTPFRTVKTLDIRFLSYSFKPHTLGSLSIDWDHQFFQLILYFFLQCRIDSAGGGRRDVDRWHSALLVCPELLTFEVFHQFIQANCRLLAYFNVPSGRFLTLGTRCARSDCFFPIQLRGEMTAVAVVFDAVAHSQSSRCLILNLTCKHSFKVD